MRLQHTTSQPTTREGTGVERDAFKAVEWYKKAAAKGITASQVQLGKLLYSVEVDGVRDRGLGS
jgi:TPR repeat protein